MLILDILYMLLDSQGFQRMCYVCHSAIFNLILLKIYNMESYFTDTYSYFHLDWENLIH